jgi:Ulp1 family protease
MDFSEWELFERRCPQQKGNIDCGVFMAQFVKCVFFELPLHPWGSSQIKKFRGMMALELMEENLRLI